MKFAVTSAAGLALALALSACGGSPEETDAAPAETPVAAETPALPGDTAAADEASAEPAPEATESAAAEPTPAPAPSASASATSAAAVEPAAFAQCKACHSAEPGKNGLGPSLAGIYGEKAGAVPGFDFSDAMKNSGIVWNEEALDRFLIDPKGTVPGNKMPFAGLKDAAKRKAIIDYIKAL
jgi:cytochrome c2